MSACLLGTLEHMLRNTQQPNTSKKEDSVRTAFLESLSSSNTSEISVTAKQRLRRPCTRYLYAKPHLHSSPPLRTHRDVADIEAAHKHDGQHNDRRECEAVLRVGDGCTDEQPKALRPDAGGRQ
eukprot:365214-Chlamydomonas_euryale.AAC.7